MTKSKGKITRGVSWPNPDVLEAARARAEELGMSLSGYVNALVRRDLALPGAFAAPLPTQRRTVAGAARAEGEALERVSREIMSLPSEQIPPANRRGNVGAGRR